MGIGLASGVWLYWAPVSLPLMWGSIQWERCWAVLRESWENGTWFFCSSVIHPREKGHKYKLWFARQIRTPSSLGNNMLNQDLPGSLGASVMARDYAAWTTAAELGEMHVLGSMKLPRSCLCPSPCDRRVILSLAYEKGMCVQSRVLAQFSGTQFPSLSLPLSVWLWRATNPPLSPFLNCETSMLMTAILWNCPESLR